MDRPTNLQPNRSDYVAIIAGAAITLVLGALSFASPAMADTSTSVTEDGTRIVRTIHGTNCDARAIGAGISPRAAPNEDLEDLSVSCTSDPAVSWDALRKAAPRAHVCVVALGDLRQIAPGVRVVRDPTEANPYHCKLSRVTPNQFVSRASWWP